MKGIILAGGNGRRLDPLTNVTNKHLLAVYDRPMIYYPLQTLLDAGLKDILIVSGKDHAGGFLRLLGSGKAFGARFSYEVQEEAGGIAQALGLAEEFAGGDNVAVILGDNVFEDSFVQTVEQFNAAAGDGATKAAGAMAGAHIFLKTVPDANRFGVAEIDGERVVSIEEKPKEPKSSHAVTGLYLFDPTVFDVIRTLKPSGRGELEITDVNNHYIQAGSMKATMVQGEWTDAGTFESLYHANRLARSMALKKKPLGNL